MLHATEMLHWSPVTCNISISGGCYRSLQLLDFLERQCFGGWKGVVNGIIALPSPPPDSLCPPKPLIPPPESLHSCNHAEAVYWQPQDHRVY